MFTSLRSTFNARRPRHNWIFLLLLLTSIGWSNQTTAQAGCPVWQQVGQLNISGVGGYITQSQIAFDKDGIAYMAYEDGGTLYLMKYNGTSWVSGSFASTGGLASATGYVGSINLVIDGNGNPCVAGILGYDGSPFVMKYNGTSWSWYFPGGDPEPNCGKICLGVDSAGTPVVAYTFFWGYTGVDGYNSVVRKFNGTGFSLIGHPAGEGIQDMAVAKDGTVYLHYSPSGAAHNIDKYDGSTWTTIGSMVNLKDLKLDHDGTPYVFAYRVSYSKHALAKYNGSSFVTISDSVSSMGGLAFNSSNVPHIITRDTPAGIDKVYKLVGSSWVPVTSSGFIMNTYSYPQQPLAFGPGDEPYVAYRDNVSNRANVRKISNNIPSISGNVTFCPGSTITLSNSALFGSWSSSNTSVATVGSTSGIVGGVTNGTATITYATGSCSATTIVTVGATGGAGTISGIASICEGTTTTLTNATTGGTWSSSDDAIATIGSATGIVTGISSGNAIITYTVSGSCGIATTTKVVTVGATSSITGSLSLCSGMTSSLSGGTTGGVWTSGNTAVATIGAANGVLTAVSTGTADITYTMSGGCTATAVVTVSMPAIIGGTSNACVGQTATLTDATPGGTWSSSNTSLATVDVTTGVVTGIAAGTATISYYVSSGCYRTIAFTVKALPPAIATPITVCEGSTVYVTPPSTNGQSWTSSNTSVAVIGSSTGMLTGVTAGTTTLTYTTNTGCYVTATASVNASPTITGTTALCSGSTSSLSSSTTGGTWNSSNNSVASVGSATGVVTAGSAGTATITYNTSGCRATTMITVSPIAAITGTPSMCVGSSATLSDATSGGTWSTSNSAIATVGTSGIVTGVAAGNATITYTIASGCTRTVTATVVATPGAITGSLGICPSTTSTLSGSTSGGTWSGGNASIATINSTTGVLTGIGAGTINVSYTLTGCRVTAIATVNPLPVVITGTTNACVAQTSTLNDATIGGAWSSANTSIATVDPSTGVVTGVSAATTTMTYTLGTGCYRTVPFTVKALPPAIATTAAACVGTSTYMAPPSTNGRSWSSSNVAVATIGSSSGMLAGMSTGTTVLTYTTTTGCYVTTEATVYALPSAGTITGPSSVVVGNTITLDDAAGGGVWSSSNVARATVGAATGIVTGVASGLVTISYSVSNTGCTVRAIKSITVATSRPGDNSISDNGFFSLYPNPTTGVFTVEADEAGTLSIYSLDGKEVNKHNIITGANQFSLPGELASGIYMCRFTGESGNTTMVRLVFER